MRCLFEARNLRILRMNHAGEHGAVAIYSPQLAHAPDAR